MPEVNLPKSTAELETLRGQAEGQMIGGTVKAAFTFAIGASVLEAARPVGPKTVDKIAHYGFGGKFKPIGRGERLRPTPLSLLYLAPAPLGIAPPEFYGLRPDYIGRAAPFLPKSELLATSASPERAAYADAMAARRELLTLQTSIRLATTRGDLERIVNFARARAAAIPFLEPDAAEIEREAVARYQNLNTTGPLVPLLLGAVATATEPAPVPQPLKQRPPVGGFRASLARRIQAANAPDPPL